MNALISAHTTVEISRIVENIPEHEDKLNDISEATGVHFLVDDGGRMHMLGPWHQILDGHNQLSSILQKLKVEFIEDVPSAYPDIDVDEIAPPVNPDEEESPSTNENYRIDKTKSGKEAAKDIISDIRSKLEKRRESRANGTEPLPAAPAESHASRPIADSTITKSPPTNSRPGTVCIEPSASQIKISDESPEPPATAPTPDPRFLGLGLYSSLAAASTASPDEELERISSFEVDGLRLFCCTGHIAKVGGDTLVNDCDRGMLMNAGLAEKISQTAGVRLRMECNRYALKNGRLKVGDVLGTGGHRTNYRLIINSVGPKWDDFDKKQDCEFTLAVTYYNTFRLAAISNSQEVNIPLLCLDREIPIEVSTKALYHGLRRFLRDTAAPHRSIKVVNLVERDLDLVQTVTEILTDNALKNTQGIENWKDSDEHQRIVLVPLQETSVTRDTKDSNHSSPTNGHNEHLNNGGHCEKDNQQKETTYTEMKTEENGKTGSISPTRKKETCKTIFGAKNYERPTSSAKAKQVSIDKKLAK